MVVLLYISWLFFCEESREGYLVIIYFTNSVIYFLTFSCEKPREGYLVIIYFINSVIYFLAFFSVKNPERVIWLLFISLIVLLFISMTFFLWRTRKGLFGYVWLSGKQYIFTFNHPCDRHIFLQTDPGPPSEKGKVMWPSQEKVWGPLL